MYEGGAECWIIMLKHVCYVVLFILERNSRSFIDVALTFLALCIGNDMMQS